MWRRFPWRWNLRSMKRQHVSKYWERADNLWRWPFDFCLNESLLPWNIPVKLVKIQTSRLLSRSWCRFRENRRPLKQWFVKLKWWLFPWWQSWLTGTIPRDYFWVKILYPSCEIEPSCLWFHQLFLYEVVRNWTLSMHAALRAHLSLVLGVRD